LQAARLPLQGIEARDNAWRYKVTRDLIKPISAQSSVRNCDSRVDCDRFAFAGDILAG
jgi:hypothetical protein